MEDVDFEKLDFPPLSPGSSLEDEMDIEEESIEELFGDKVSFNYESVFIDKSLDTDDVKMRLALGPGYIVHVPGREVRIWMSCGSGWHEILTLWFRLGFQIPMHPFL